MSTKWFVFRRRDRTPDTRGTTATYGRRARVATAWVLVAGMIALQFNVWMAGAVEPMILAVPITYWYFILYGMVSGLTVWLIIRLVWPAAEPQDLHNEEKDQP